MSFLTEPIRRGVTGSGLGFYRSRIMSVYVSYQTTVEGQARCRFHAGLTVLLGGYNGSGSKVLNRTLRAQIAQRRY